MFFRRLSREDHASRTPLGISSKESANPGCQKPGHSLEFTMHFLEFTMHFLEWQRSVIL